MNDKDARAKLRARFERAAAAPPLMMLYPPVSTGAAYSGSPGVETLWGGVAGDGTLYVHVPYCHVRCVFCPFHATVARSEEHASYADALLREARRWSAVAAQTRFTSVYFGGGTPSLLGAPLVERILRDLGGCFRIDGADVTLEANPATVDAASLRDYAAAGVTRVSLGVQSYDAGVLEASGRADTIPHVRAATEAALAAPFREVNVDLMYGLPEQDHELWRADLRTATELGVHGLTLYAAVYLPALQARCDAHAYRVANAEDRARMYDAAWALLGEAGYHQPHFGAGAFQRKGPNPHRANLAQGLPTLGIGTWAFSSTPSWAWHNAFPRATWEQALERGELPIRQLVPVPVAERPRKWVVEALLLAYVDLDAFRATFGVELADAFPTELAVLDELDLARIDARELRLTRRGGRHLREVRYLFASEAVVAAVERAPGL